MANRTTRSHQAAETLEIFRLGQYQNDHGETVEVGDAAQRSIVNTRLFTPADIGSLRKQRRRIIEQRSDPVEPTRFNVINCTTLEAAYELVVEQNESVLALNFASAKNPGGGFLNGSQAQEESLARASALYLTINPQQEYYRRNRQCRSCLYTHHLIHSPNVPVIRNDAGGLLSNFYPLSIITSPAVNAGQVRGKEKQQIASVMLERIEQVLNVALIHDHDILILGAWGCGVFRNDPELIADLFDQHLLAGEFRNVFRRIVFAVLDRNGEAIISPFRKRFD